MQKTKNKSDCVDVRVSHSLPAVSHPVFCFPTAVIEVHFVIFFPSHVCTSLLDYKKVFCCVCNRALTHG